MTVTVTLPSSNGYKVMPDAPVRIEGIDIAIDGTISVDWQKLGLGRPPKEEELRVAQIYFLYKRKHGEFPNPKTKYGVIEEYCHMLGKPPVTKVEIDASDRAELFPHYPKISPHTLYRRLTGDPATLFSIDESRHALRFLCERLTTQAEHDRRVIPTTKDCDDAVRAGLIVPGTMHLMPTGRQLMTILGPEGWSDICVRELNATREELLERHEMRVEVADLENEYPKAFAHFFPDYKDGDQSYLTLDMLDQYREHGGMGQSRYSAVFARESKARGKRFSLADVQRAAGLPVNPAFANRTPRAKKVYNWSKPTVYAAFIALWDFDCCEFPPATERLYEVCRLQREVINAGMYCEVEVIRNGKPERELILDADAAKNARVPKVIVPSVEIIVENFGSSAHFLKFVGHASGRSVELPDHLAQRNAELAKGVIKKIKKDNEGVLPSKEKIELEMKKIPASVARVVRKRLSMTEPVPEENSLVDPSPVVEKEYVPLHLRFPSIRPI